MIADLFVYELGDVMLLTLPRDVKDAVLAKLDQFIFSEDVQLGDVTDTFAQIARRRSGGARGLRRRSLDGVGGRDAARAAGCTATLARRVERRAGHRHAHRPTPASPGSISTSSARRLAR